MCCDRACPQPGLEGRFSRDGYFSEPGYLGFSDYERAEYKAAGKPLDDRIKGKQITSSSDRSGALDTCTTRCRWLRCRWLSTAHPAVFHCCALLVQDLGLASLPAQRTKKLAAKTQLSESLSGCMLRRTRSPTTPKRSGTRK